MPNYHDVQADLMDRIASVHADAELTLLTTALLEDIATASRPGTLAGTYRPATWSAVNLARKAYRRVMSLVTAQDFKKIMATLPIYSHPTRRDAAGVWIDDQKTSKLFVGD